LKHAAPIAAIAAVFIGAAAWIHPLRDVPIVDDWTYAWSVEHLLKSGELRIADISSVYPIVQILWGALFARLFGLSFGVLRLSTVAIAIAGCVAVYFTLCELGCSRRWSTLGALALAVHPVYFALAFSYMTDVPVAALTLLAMLFAVQAAARDRPARLWIAAAFALAAFLVRATAIVIPLAILAATAWRRRGALRWVAPMAVSIAVTLAAWVVLHRAFGSLDVESDRLERLQWLAMVTPHEYLEWNLRLVWQTSIAFAPLLVAATVGRLAWRRVTVVAVIAGVLAWLVIHHLPSPLPDWDTWSLQDVGGGRVLIGAFAPTSAWSARALPVITVVGVAAAAAGRGNRAVAGGVQPGRDQRVVAVQRSLLPVTGAGTGGADCVVGGARRGATVDRGRAARRAVRDLPHRHPRHARRQRDGDGCGGRSRGPRHSGVADRRRLGAERLAAVGTSRAPGARHGSSRQRSVRHLESAGRVSHRQPGAARVRRGPHLRTRARVVAGDGSGLRLTQAVRHARSPVRDAR
jgi:hypothetical protein